MLLGGQGRVAGTTAPRTAPPWPGRHVAACTHPFAFTPTTPAPPAVVTGELALAVPALGVSQRLLNKDHKAAYYDGMPAVPGGR